MVEWRKFVADYLTFSRKDRIAIIVILVLIPVVFFLPKALSYSKDHSSISTDSTWVISMKKLEQKQIERKQYAEQTDAGNVSNYQFDKSTTNDKIKGELFYFDPNTLSTEEWQRLGIRDKTIKTIQNYLSKGGQFRKPEDLQRIYGLFPNEFERIAPFIRITSVNETHNYKEFEKYPAKTYNKEYSVLDINTVDSTSLISLPGIGSKLSARIINFREKLGGFYSIDQVAETFGLPDSTFQKIKPYLILETNSIRKININTASIDELKNHPYIRYSLANPIIAYRNEHGAYAKVEDIKKVMVVTENVYNKIAPYLTL